MVLVGTAEAETARVSASEGSPMVRSVAAVGCFVYLLLSLPGLPAQVRQGKSQSGGGSGTLQPSRGTKAAPAGRSRLADETAGGAAEGAAETPAEGAEGAEQPAAGGAVIMMKGRPQGRRAPAMTAEQEQELDGYLEQWSKASSGIFRMEGDIWRHEYDLTFETEKLSRGSFAYEQPDKGKMELNFIRVTPQVLERRQQEVDDAKQNGRPSPHRLKTTGEPFDLTDSEDEEWWCNGQRIFQLNKQKRQAVIMAIPAAMQGTNIMDSPLPFLFGMPRDKARHRFEIGYNKSQSPKPGATRLHLVIYPNLPQDAASWDHADVMLDVQTWLPIAVQMYDPAETTVTVYRFEKLQINQKSFIRNFWNGGKPSFEPNLAGWTIMRTGEGEGLADDGGPPAAEKAPLGKGLPRGLQRPAAQIEAGRVPDLTGQPHKQAVETLAALGLSRDEKNPKASRVVLLPGPPAATKAAIYTVESQDPQPGSEIKPNTRVTVRLFTDPAKAAKGAEGAKAAERPGTRVN